jgi:hypothetical protein
VQFCHFLDELRAFAAPGDRRKVASKPKFVSGLEDQRSQNGTTAEPLVSPLRHCASVGAVEIVPRGD